LHSFFFVFSFTSYSFFFLNYSLKVMSIPNLHTQPNVRSRREAVRMIVAYRLPLLIFVSAVALSIGYNAFFYSLLQSIMRTRFLEEALYDRLNGLQSDVFWLNYRSTWRYSLVALCVGDVLFALMFASFLRAVFTCAGYVPPEPWRWPPKADVERQRVLREAWSRQQEWMRTQEVRAQQQVAQAQQFIRQQQQLWFDMQVAYLQQQQQQLQHMRTLGGPASSVMPLTSPSAASLTPALHLPVSRTECAPHVGATGDGGEGRRGFHGDKANSAHTLHGCSSGAEEGHQYHSRTSLSPTAETSSTLLDVSIASGTEGEQLHGCSTDDHLGTARGSSGGVAAQPPLATPQLCPFPLTLHTPPRLSVSPTPPPTTTATSELSSSSSFCEMNSSISDAPPANAEGGCHACTHARPSHLPPLCFTGAVMADTSLNAVAVHEYEADGALRFCDVCHQYKPDGSHHCRTCQRCVFDMDHHCHFLNNCVGRRNYKFFFLCVFYSTLCGTVNSALVAFAFVGSAVTSEWGNGWWWVPAGMSAIGACVTYLCVQHVFLLVRGVSTLDRMAQLASERFLAQFSGGRVLTAKRSGCHTDCVLTAQTCLQALLHQAQHVVSRITGTHRRGAYAGRPLSSLIVSSPTEYMLTPAMRRARRVELLFGRPRHVWEYFLPVAPHGVGGLSGEKAGNRVLVETL
jgi:hypothetical protein